MRNHLIAAGLTAATVAIVLAWPSHNPCPELQTQRAHDAAAASSLTYNGPLHRFMTAESAALTAEMQAQGCPLG
jgi:hypothetical protein